jgi:16S rRNA (cytidine1402-2'-O)-methyltransferase
VGRLFIVATPIGNLGDISFRAIQVLKDVVLIAAEDTRRSQKLLAHYNISTPLISYFEHNKITRLEKILESLETGDVALVSDAGTPGLSDPGYELMQAATGAGNEVVVIPGPSAPIAALISSGLPTDEFIYLGYAPRKQGERREWLAELGGERRTVIFFEVPHRLLKTLKDLVDVLGADRTLCVCRELTKQYEEVLRGTAESALLHFETNEPRGEFTMVLGGAEVEERWSEAELRQAVRALRTEGSGPSQAARELANASGWPRSAVYQMILEEG